jgi:hypothetical protein
MKIIFYLLLALFSVAAWSCPNCHTAIDEGNRPPYTIIFLGLFICLTYIPFFILFRAAKKFDPKN